MTEGDRERNEPVTEAGRTILNEVLGERYQVVSKLGTGAFGEVYRAKDGVLGREVAVKRIRMDAFAEPGQVEEVNKRFRREAQVAAQLRHHNIVTTHDIVSSPSMSFIVMELVEGRTLSSLLKSRVRLGLAETLDLLSQVAAALDHAHQNHVVHRDVKPANIMIEPSGHVKVMDFGIAKLDSGTNLTASGHIVGTPNYMSPEQARGEKVDGRSDLFSLGCILYECVTGGRAFKGDNVTAVLMKVLTDEPAPIDYRAIGLPYELGSVIARALDKRAAERFATGAELIEAVRGVASLGPAAATLVGAARIAEPPPVAARAPRDHPQAPPAPRASLGRVVPWVAAILLAVTAGYLWSRGSQEARSAPASGAPGALVVEEEPGFLGKIFGTPSRLVITVPADTSLSLVLGTPLSSETAGAGDVFTATLASGLSIEGVEAVPAGSHLEGHVSHASGAGKVAGRGELTLELDSLTLPDGSRTNVQAAPIAFEARGTKKKDAGIIGGLAGVGAVVGGLIGGKKGAAIGGAAGGGAGTAVVVTTEGEQVILGEGAKFSSRLTSAFTVTRLKPSAGELTP